MDWEELFESHADDLVGICWRILGRRVDVEDCVQEAFVKAVQIERRETIRNWPGLLRRLAVLTALEVLRKRRLRNDTLLSESVYDPPASAAGADELAIQRELENRLRQEVAALPDREGRSFLLAVFRNGFRFGNRLHARNFHRSRCDSIAPSSQTLAATHGRCAPYDAAGVNRL